MKGTLAAAPCGLVPGAEVWSRSRRSWRPVGVDCAAWACREWWQHLSCVAQEVLRRWGFGTECRRVLLCSARRSVVRLGTDLGQCKTVRVGVMGGSSARVGPRVAAVFCCRGTRVGRFGVRNCRNHNNRPSDRRSSGGRRLAYANQEHRKKHLRAPPSRGVGVRIALQSLVLRFLLQPRL